MQSRYRKGRLRYELTVVRVVKEVLKEYLENFKDTPVTDSLKLDGADRAMYSGKVNCLDRIGSDTTCVLHI